MINKRTNNPTMGTRAETCEEIRKEKITKIFGQPIEQDIIKMEK
jgi:hypothetical protein